MKVSDFFELRGKLPRVPGIVVGIIGFVFLILVWSLLTTLGAIPQSLLPPPWKVLTAFKELHFQDALIRNALYSIKLNLLGYIEAIAISIPIGFFIGLFPVLRSGFNKYVDALRFVPLAAATGLFICWFGIDDNMKVQFLAV
jgi:ABC-type nitrate/sulfonate/bicarbonate transport system permease component